MTKYLTFNDETNQAHLIDTEKDLSLIQLGQLWSDFLHAERQANKAVKDFCYRETVDDYPENKIKYFKPEIQQERDIKKELMENMWDKQKISNELYKKLIDTTEQYWIKEAT